MRKLLILFFFSLGVALSSCATNVTTPDVQTPRQGIAACYYTVRTAFNTAADMKARGALPATQEKQVTTWGDQALAACDSARVALTAGDLSTTESQLKVAESVLLQLENWLKTQSKTP